MTGRAAAFALAFALLLPACGGARSPRCQEACEIEARCALERQESDTFRSDRGECIAACAALERDREGRKLVEDHLECIRAAGEDCRAVFACP